jgi:hypothetical protein
MNGTVTANLHLTAWPFGLENGEYYIEMNALELAWITRNIIYELVTNPSLIPLKPTRIGG